MRPRWLRSLWATITGRDMANTPGDRLAAIIDNLPKPRPIREIIDTRADCHASGAVTLAAYVIRGKSEFSLCGHHLSKHRVRLEAEGWTIIGMDRTLATTGSGTESTPSHYALEG